MFIKVFAISDGFGSGETAINVNQISHMMENYVTMIDGRKYFLQDEDVLRVRNILTENQFGCYSKKYD